MKLNSLRQVLIFGIVTAVSGCDNVTWGGVDMRLEPPPTREIPAADTLAAAEDTVPDWVLPDGPVLLAGDRSGQDLVLQLVAVQREGVWESPPEGEVDPRYLTAFRNALLPVGTRYVLFSQGVRVGTLRQTSPAAPGTGYCGEVLEISGVPELVPAAAGATRFVAVPESVAADRPYQAYRNPASTYDQRVGSLDVASRLIATIGAPWPPSILESRASLQIRQLDEERGLGLVATFLYQDQLSVGSARANAYSLFFTALPTSGGQYEPDFIWYRRYDDQGKAAPRIHSQVDLDGDGKDELLLDVFGEETRWYQLQGFRSGEWRTLFSSSCAETVGEAWIPPGS